MRKEGSTFVSLEVAPLRSSEPEEIRNENPQESTTQRTPPAEDSPYPPRAVVATWGRVRHHYARVA